MSARPTTAPPVRTFTLSRITLPDGCVMPNVPPVLAAAMTACGLARERQGFPRFRLQVDGHIATTDRLATLRTWLEAIAIGSTCRVFRNGGQGATIDFDTNGK